MGAVDATFSALNTLFAADDGPGSVGLNEEGSNARIRNFLRHTSPKLNAGEATCIVRVTPMRAYDGRADAMQVCEVQFEIEVSRKQGFTRANAIRDRLRTVYNGITPAATGGYSFSPMVFRGSTDGGSEQDRVLVDVYEVLVFVTGTAPLLGFAANLSVGGAFTGGQCIYWELNEGKPFVNSTRPIDDRERWTLGTNDGHGIMRFYATGLPPTQGSYTGAVFTLASGVTITRTIVTGPCRTIVSFGVGRPTIHDVPFRVTVTD